MSELTRHGRTAAGRVIPPIALLVMLSVNGLANYLPFNGITTGEVSDLYPSLFTPAPWVFAIWGLIYVLLLGFVIYQALPAQRANTRLSGVIPLFALSCVLNAAWLGAWHYLLVGLSMVLMLALLFTLIAIYRRLDIGRHAVSRRERLLVDLPFSVYLGWITVATVANASAFLLDAGFDGGGAARLITVLVIAVAGAIGVLALRLRSDLAFALVLVWAFVGIAAARYPQTPGVSVAALAAALALIALSAANLWRGRTGHRSRPGVGEAPA